MWSGVARLLASRFRVVKPDLPGRGGTAAPARGDLEQYVDFVEALARQLPSPLGMAGFSMGGYVTLAFLRRRPEQARAIAFVDTRATADDEAGRKKRDESIETVKSQGVAAIAEAMVGKLLSAESLRKIDLVERVRRIILRQKPETITADLAAMRDRADSTSFLPQIAVPALVVVGEEDALTPPSDSEAMTAAIPSARMVRIPGAGHLAPMERPKAVAAALGDFFGETLRT
jgi:pimeloyl-ACP methyl ester carboxylesterase